MKPRLLLSLKLIGLIVFTSLYIILSMKGLYFDVINPDGINWHNRTFEFTNAIETGMYKSTYQVYHPGITLMWISGPLLNNFYDTQATYENNDSEKAAFLTKDYYAKTSLVLFSAIIFLLTFIILWQFISYKYAGIFSILFIMEPFILGMRRLYHLDYLMTTLLFAAFLIICYFSYKQYNYYHLTIAGLLTALAILTKTTAIIIIPAIILAFLLGNVQWKVKVKGLLVFFISLIVFIYSFFPAIWTNPLHYFPVYYKNIIFGVSEIGVTGKKEIGSSGIGQNKTLERVFKNNNPDYYIESLLIRMTPGFLILLIPALIYYCYQFSKGLIKKIYSCAVVKLKDLSWKFLPDSWLSFYSTGISIGILIALTLAVKKSDRYIIMVFPFLITLITHYLYRMKIKTAGILIFLYCVYTAYALKSIFPYYLAYSNPYLGGIEHRLSEIDKAPFGIGIYEAFQIVKNDMDKNNYSGFYTISGTKSIKAICAGGKFSLYPSCRTDYSVVYAYESPPTERCAQKYKLIGSVKIAGFDYWNIYKRTSQLHQGNYD
jgi:hypothetical protein